MTKTAQPRLAADANIGAAFGARLRPSVVRPSAISASAAPASAAPASAA